MRTPDTQWLEKAILAYGKGFIPEPVVKRFAQHIIGNWLVVEDNRVRELVDALDKAWDLVHQLHSNPLAVGRGICEWKPCQELGAALARFDKAESPA